MCIMYVSGTYEAQQRVSVSLELELWTLVSHYAGAGNWASSWEEQHKLLTVRDSSLPEMPFLIHW